MLTFNGWEIAKTPMTVVVVKSISSLKTNSGIQKKKYKVIKHSDQELGEIITSYSDTYNE